MDIKESFGSTIAKHFGVSEGWAISSEIDGE